MQAIELETSIIQGEIHARLPKGISVKKAKLIVMYEEEPSADGNTASDMLSLLDDIVDGRSWPIKSKQNIDLDIDKERAAWD